MDVLAVSGKTFYAGGSFTEAGGIQANHVAQWDGSAWAPMGSGLGESSEPRLPVDVTVLRVWNGDLYVGGTFAYAGGQLANSIAKWDGTMWVPLGSGVVRMWENLSGKVFTIPGTVSVLTGLGDDLYVGGVFTNAGGIQANSLAKWDGSSWSSLGTGFVVAVSVLAASGTDLYVGGNFNTADGIEANAVAKWDGSGWLALGSPWTALVSVANGTRGRGGQISDLVVLGTDLYLGYSDWASGFESIVKWDGSAGHLWVPG